MTRLDHDANVRPWVLAAADAGATVRWVDVHDDDVTIDVGSFDAALSPRTKLVAFTLASNAVGTILPAADLVTRAKEVGALVAVDGVHLAQHRLPDLHGLGADLLVCSPYKFFGPHLGILAARRHLLAEWSPYKLVPSSDDVPERWETGTQNHEGLAGLVAAVDYLAGLSGTPAPRVESDSRPPSTRSPRTSGCSPTGSSPASAELPARPTLGHRRPRSHGERTPTFAIRIGDEHPAETAKALAARGISVWDGDYYAREIMVRLGLLETGGAVRVGFCHYHSADEVDRVLAALGELG